MGWTVPLPWTCLHRSVGTARPVSTPSVHKERLGSGLARPLQAVAFPDFERIHHNVSSYGAQLNRNPVLYPTELRGHTVFVY